MPPQPRIVSWLPTYARPYDKPSMKPTLVFIHKEIDMPQIIATIDEVAQKKARNNKLYLGISATVGGQAGERLISWATNIPIEVGNTYTLEVGEGKDSNLIQRVIGQTSPGPAPARPAPGNGRAPFGREDPVGQSIERQVALKAANDFVIARMQYHGVDCSSDYVAAVAQKFAAWVRGTWTPAREAVVITEPTGLKRDKDMEKAEAKTLLDRQKEPQPAPNRRGTREEAPATQAPMKDEEAPPPADDSHEESQETDPQLREAGF